MCFLFSLVFVLQMQILFSILMNVISLLQRVNNKKTNRCLCGIELDKTMCYIRRNKRMEFVNLKEGEKEGRRRTCSAGHSKYFWFKIVQTKFVTEWECKLHSAFNVIHSRISLHSMYHASTFSNPTRMAKLSMNIISCTSNRVIKVIPFIFFQYYNYHST